MVASNRNEAQVVKIAAVNIHSSKNMITDSESELKLARETLTPSTVFNGQFDKNQSPRSAIETCVEYRRTDYEGA